MVSVAFETNVVRRRGVIESSSNDDGDGIENGKKSTGLDWRQNNNFARASRFLYIPLPSLHDYDVKLPNFTFCGGREHKTDFLFLFVNFDESFRMKLQKNTPIVFESN